MRINTLLIPTQRIGSRYGSLSAIRLERSNSADCFVRFGARRKPQSFVIDHPYPIDLQNMKPYEKLIEAVKAFALPQVSGYRVGEVGIGESGKAYLGVNVEIKAGDYSDTIHGEQFLVSLARKKGEAGLRQLVVSAEPCGHCRQFLMEGGQVGLEIIHLVKQAQAEASFSKMIASKQWNRTTLGELLPGPFTLATPENNVFNAKPLKIEAREARLSKLAKQALEAARTSYTPWSENTWAGIALELKDGSVYTGSVIENTAYNPTLPPFQDAIVGMVADHQKLSDIQKVVLVEPVAPNFSYAQRTRTALKSLAPHTTFQVIKAEKKS
jgi:cytidine deaminase